jgi:CPA2 family monovalent cation:H+ antiporter-2
MSTLPRKESNLAGQTLRDIRIRELWVNIAFIKRGEIMIQIPKQNDYFLR